MQPGHVSTLHHAHCFLLYSWSRSHSSQAAHAGPSALDQAHTCPRVSSCSSCSSARSRLDSSQARQRLSFCPLLRLASARRAFSCARAHGAGVRFGAQHPPSASARCRVWPARRASSPGHTYLVIGVGLGKNAAIQLQPECVASARRAFTCARARCFRVCEIWGLGSRQRLSFCPMLRWASAPCHAPRTSRNSHLQLLPCSKHVLAQPR